MENIIHVTNLFSLGGPASQIKIRNFRLLLLQFELIHQQFKHLILIDKNARDLCLVKKFNNLSNRQNNVSTERTFVRRVYEYFGVPTRQYILLTVNNSTSSLTLDSSSKCC